MKAMYLVLCLVRTATVKTTIGGRDLGNTSVSFDGYADRCIGVCPVFTSVAAAKKYIGKRGFVIQKIRTEK
jgi:hypothetical protein